LLGNATAFDYSLYFQQKLRSVPTGNGTAVFHGSVANISNQSETLSLEPGTAFGDWTADFLVCGDNNPHLGPTQITLAPNRARDFQVRVHTNGAKEIRGGSFKVTSLTTGRLQETNLRVFNGSPSILFVDNDGSTSYQGSFINALNNDGYLYDDWDTQQGGAPGSSSMNGFDIVIWHTAGRVSNSAVLTSTDAANLMNYMDQGGAVFVESNYYLNSLQGVGNAFVNNYLGVASWNLDKAYLQLNGVAGDAISETDPDPNNTRVLVHRIIDWLTPEGTADTGPIAARFTSGIEQARPNPFRRGRISRSRFRRRLQGRRCVSRSSIWAAG